MDVVAVVVEDIAGPVLAAALGSLKWIVITAGPSWSVVRFMVMGIAGLWYFILVRQCRQNFLVCALF